MKIGIIGFANRGHSLSPRHYNKMVTKMHKVLNLRENCETLEVCTGGSIWSDHIAVTLYLQNIIPQLTLHLPDEWSSINQSYAGTTESGRRLNGTHKLFSQMLGRNTLAEIDEAIKKGAHYTISSSSQERNKLIAYNAEHLYAFVVTNNQMTSGTKNTWDQCKGKRIKIYISQ